MTLSTNDNFANRELSIDELETIAAGGLFGWIGHEITSAVGYVLSPAAHAVEKFGEALMGGGNVVYAVPHKMR
jgi:hypothetical protein